MFNSSAPRPGGGFNPGMGDSFGEHMDENAMQQAMQQKALTQQQGSAGAAAPGVAQQKAQQQQQKPPRSVGTLGEELIKRPISGVIEQLKGFFDVNNWLGIEPAKDDAEKQAKQQQMMQRYNKLNSEQQAVAKQKYQEEIQRKKAEEEQKQRQKQAEEQRKSQSIDMPSSPQKGAAGPGGKKQKAVQKLQNDRKTLSGPSSAN